MKNLIFAITLILCINVCAQNGFENTYVFVRVYDLQGKKIGKGKIFSISETSLQLNRKGESVKIPVSSIGSIKTKHSAGNNVLIGAVTGATTMAIFGVVTAGDGYLYTAECFLRKIPQRNHRLTTRLEICIHKTTNSLATSHEDLLLKEKEGEGLLDKTGCFLAFPLRNLTEFLFN